MDNQYLRTTILKLLYHLSDNDRQGLHFILASHVPRRIRDDQSISGTLHLMESLFDQDKISEQNITILIQAFGAIQCVEGLKILKEHKKQIQINLSTSRNSRSEVLSLNDEIIADQEEDKSSSQCLLYRENNYGEGSKVIKGNHTNINPVTINVDTKQIMSSLPGEEQPFSLSFKLNKCLFCVIVLLLLAFGVIMTVLIVQSNNTNCPTKDKHVPEELEEKTRLIEKLKTEKDQEIARLSNRVNELEKENNLSRVKAGRKFGGTSGTDFDDSSSSDFECSHFLNGLLTRSDADGMETYQFLYYSPRANYQKIQSQFHGDEDFDQKYEFEFGKNEKINRVDGQIVNKSFRSKNGTIITKSVITGLKFTSTEDRASPSFNELSGIHFNESFVGYTLGYVTGRSSQYIEQLQFFWYRM